MNLLQKLKKIENLNGKTRIKAVCVDGIVVEGFYRGYTSALNNEPEIPQIDIQNSLNGGLVGLLETEIESIEVI